MIQSYFTSILGAKWDWDSLNNNRVIILTTDMNIRPLNISSAFLLIHYDVPVNNLRAFAMRFSFLWSHARDLTKEIDKFKQVS